MDATVSGRFQRAALGPRTLTAVVGIPLLLAALWGGGPWWIAVTAVITLIGVEEFARIHALRPSRTGGLLLLAAAVFGALLAGSGAVVTAVITIWLVLITLEAATQLRSPGATLRHVPAWLLLGPLYLAVPTSLLARWRLELPPESILAFLLIIWASDTAAYFVGVAAGRHKLAPRISPAKSWEGAFAGASAGAAVGLAAASWLGMAPPVGAVFGAVTTAASQVGDLLESAMKRRAGVKDSGTLLPGHGGILDRFDGILLAAPVAYVLMRIWAAGR